MIDAVILHNTYTGDSVEIDQEHGTTYILEQVDLGVVTSNHTTYKYLNQVGVYVTNSTLETRDINIIGWVTGADDGELQIKRKLLNRMINPLHEMELTLRDEFKLNFLPTTSINYSPEYSNNNEVACRFLISGFCPDPMWYLSRGNSVLIAFTTPYFHFPLIIPQDTGIIFGLREPSQISEIEVEGDVYTGIEIIMKATGSVINPRITDLVTQEYIAINKTMIAGEVIVISTFEGKKSITGTIDGITTNYYQYRDLNSSWLQLQPGQNVFQYDAEQYASNLQVEINFHNRFLEVE